MERIWEIIHKLEKFNVESIDDKKYLIDLLRKNISSKNNLLKSEIITCISENNVLDDNSTKIILNTLKDKCNYIIKLSALDFILMNRERFNEAELLEVYISLCVAKKSRVRLVKNQALLLLRIFDNKNKQIYIDELFSSLSLTNDYRSFIRLFNTIYYYNLKEYFNKLELDKFIFIAKEKKFGISVKNAIERMGKT